MVSGNTNYNGAIWTRQSRKICRIVNFFTSTFYVFLIKPALFAGSFGKVQPAQFFRGHALPSQLPQAQSVMPFRQSFAFVIQHQRAVKKKRHHQTQRAIKQNLTRRADQQIRPAHNFRNPHRRVVHDACKLIRRHIITAPDHKIAKVFSRDEFLLATIPVGEGNNFAIRHAKTPAEFPAPDFRLSIMPAGAGINRLVIVVRVRRTRGNLDIFARASAGIDEISGAQFLQRGAVKIHPFTLVVWRKRAANIRPFAPLKTKPVQICEHRIHKLHLETRGVQILVPQNQDAATGAGALLRRPECSRVTEVQIARRRWREPAPVWRTGSCNWRIHGGNKQ